MKEICLVNKGDNVKKLSVTLGISPQSKVSETTILNNKYIVVKDGCDDIISVKNYSPLFIKKITKENTLLDIYASGYEVLGNNNAGNDDIVVIKKINGIRYVVSPMEKLEDIAHKFGVEKNTIIEKNNLKTDKLFVGQVLFI